MQTQVNDPWGELEGAYKNAQGTVGGEFKPLPTGNYQAKVLENQFDVAKFSFKRKFQIITGEFTGKIQNDWIHLRKSDGTPNEIGVDRLKSEIRLFSSEWAALPLKDVIAPYCNATLDQIVNIYASTKDGVDKAGKPITNSSIYINEFVSVEDDAQSPAGGKLPF